MNEFPANEEPAPVATEYLAEAEQYVRRNPIAALFAAAGTGLAIALLVRALRPEPTPQHRLARLIEDLEGRLRDAAAPVLRKAGALAGDGLDAAHHGEARVERALGDATRRLRRLFS